MAEATREIDVGGHTVRITGGEEPVRAFRGFFYGDAIGVSHHADTAGETLAARGRGVPGDPDAQPPSGVVTIEIDDASFELHRLPEGYLHSHQLPFMAFRSVDEAVETLVAIVERGSAHGRATESQSPH